MFQALLWGRQELRIAFNNHIQKDIFLAVISLSKFTVHGHTEISLILIPIIITIVLLSQTLVEVMKHFGLS